MEGFDNTILLSIDIILIYIDKIKGTILPNHLILHNHKPSQWIYFGDTSFEKKYSSQYL